MLGTRACPGLEPDSKDVNQPTLLVIDDEPSLAKLIAHAARTCGYVATLTTQAEDFKRQHEVTGPDVIALDLGMPSVDGVELLRWLGATGSRARILVISGFDRRVLETVMRLGQELGLAMAPPLEKPIRLAALEDVLSGFCRGEAA